jgi:hypothetical protein
VWGWYQTAASSCMLKRNGKVARRDDHEAVLLHRDIAIRTERLKTLKADVIREARRHNTNSRQLTTGAPAGL